MGVRSDCRYASSVVCRGAAPSHLFHCFARTTTIVAARTKVAGRQTPAKTLRIRVMSNTLPCMDPLFARDSAAHPRQMRLVCKSTMRDEVGRILSHERFSTESVVETVDSVVDTVAVSRPGSVPNICGRHFACCQAV